MMPRLGKAALLLLLTGALSACVGPARQQLNSLSEIQDGEVLVVGRVELVPALGQGEQALETLGSGYLKDKFYLLASDTFRRLDHEPEAADYDGRIEAYLGKDYTVRSGAKPFFVLGGMLMLESRGDRATQVFFPGGLKIPVRPGDKAVYVGTLRYHRNEFFEISRIDIVDDYDRANAEFKKTYGAKYSLRRALMTPVK